MSGFAFYVRVLNESGKGFVSSENIEHILKDVMPKVGLKLRDATYYHMVDHIDDTIRSAIKEADVVVADATTDNENIWYEIGYADSIDFKKVVLIYHSPRDDVCSKTDKTHSLLTGLPFDRSNLLAVPISYQKEDTNKERNKKHKDIVKSLVKIINNIQSTQTIRKLLRSESPEYRINEHISKNPKIKSQACEHLRNIVNNVEEGTEIRKRSLYSLFKLGEIDDTSLLKASAQDIDYEVRRKAFQVVGEMKKPVPMAIWENALKPEDSVVVMRQFAKSATIHFLAEFLPSSFFAENFLDHERWEVRKHIAMQCIETSSDSGVTTRTLDIVKTLLKEDEEESVVNRFSDFSRRLKNKIDRGHKPTPNEVAMVNAITSQLTSTSSPWAKTMLKKFSSIPPLKLEKNN